MLKAIAVCRIPEPPAEPRHLVDTQRAGSDIWPRVHVSAFPREGGGLEKPSPGAVTRPHRHCSAQNRYWAFDSFKHTDICVPWGSTENTRLPVWQRLPRADSGGWRVHFCTLKPAWCEHRSPLLEDWRVRAQKQLSTHSRWRLGVDTLALLLPGGARAPRAAARSAPGAHARPAQCLAASSS